MNARHLSRRARGLRWRKAVVCELEGLGKRVRTNSELADLVTGPDADLIELLCGIPVTAMQGQLRTRTNGGKHADPGPM